MDIDTAIGNETLLRLYDLRHVPADERLLYHMLEMTLNAEEVLSILRSQDALRLRDMEPRMRHIAAEIRSVVKQFAN